MRLLFSAFGATACAACFNVTSPDGPPPPVSAPVVACTIAVDAGPICDPFASGDAEVDATTASTTCDAGPPIYSYDECALPPSVCADSHWAAYFDNGTCVKGQCELVTKYHYCETGCSGGGCINHSSTAIGRGF